MKNRDEISAMLTSFVDAKPEEQGTLISGVLDEFDVCRNEANAYTDGCPEGSSNWREAYDNLRKDYVRSFLNHDKQEEIKYQEPNSKSITVDAAAEAFVKQMFGRK